MERKKYFEKYDSRLVREGILRALVCGAAVGLAANAVTAFVCWCLPDITWGLWLALGVLVAVTAAATAIFYFVRFRPTVKRSAKRLDALGLEERLITMVEYEDDSSLIANIQREDAKENLNKLDVKAIKIMISRVSIVLASVALFFGAGLTTLTALKDAGLIPSIPSIMEQFEPPKPDVYVAVTYMAGEGGYLEGEEDQIILLGGDTEMILAVAEDGYVFMEWSDGSKNISRAEKNVQEDLVLEAVFGMLEDGNGEGDGGEAEGEEGDKPGDKPSKSDEAAKPDADPQAGASGRYEDHNQIIDGRTYYGDKFADAYETMSETLANNSDMSSELKEMVQTYFDIIKVETDGENPWEDSEEEE